MSSFASNLRRLLTGFTAAGRAAQLQQRREVRAQASAATERRLQDEDPFIQAIAAEPDSDVPRLVFADWLEERGDPRAEFIRVQCELAALKESDPRYVELKQAERPLREQHERLWEAAFRRRTMWWNFSRGFVEEIGILALKFVDEARPIFRRAPIRHIKLYDVQKHMGELAASPFLARVQTLSFTTESMGDAGAKSLAASVQLECLTKLRLDSCNIGDEGAEALASAPQLAKLTEFSFCNTLPANDYEEVAPNQLNHDPDWLFNRIGDTGAEALARSPYLNQLVSLQLWGNPISERGVHALVARFGDRVQFAKPEPPGLNPLNPPVPT